MSSSTSRSASKYPEASGVFHRPLVAKLLRLVFDTAALRGSVGMRPSLPRRRRLPDAWLVSGLLTLGLTGLLGCQSAKAPGSMSHASVQIQGHTLVEIQQTTTAVFREEGYGLAVTTPEEMVFERPGSRRDAAKWGGWSGAGVTMRVKVALSESLNGGHLLQADAYAVQNSDDPFFQSESRNILLSRRPYQKLLDEVADRLK